MGLFFIPYPVSISESDILICRISSNRIWNSQNGFGTGFGAKIILSVYTPTLTCPPLRSENEKFTSHMKAYAPIIEKKTFWNIKRIWISNWRLYLDIFMCTHQVPKKIIFFMICVKSTKNMTCEESFLALNIVFSHLTLKNSVFHETTLLWFFIFSYNIKNFSFS